ncbi:MAG: hypothetical protein ACI4TV_03950 [Paludibacteraceae bacterium]
MQFLQIKNQLGVETENPLINYNDGAFAYQQDENVVYLAIPINNRNNNNLNGIDARGIGSVDYAIFLWDEYESLNDEQRQEQVSEYTRMLKYLHSYSMRPNELSEQNIRNVISLYKNSKGNCPFNPNCDCYAL